MNNARTLLFCTSHFRDATTWQGRYLRWIEHHRAFSWLYRAMVLIDDGSPYKPDQSRVTIFEAADVGKRPLPRCALVRFPNNLGRSGTTVYPGWCRSFLFSLDVAEAYGFDKIVHVESDAYLLSSAIADYIERAKSGWIAFWSPSYQFPETALQIVCEDAYPAFSKLRDSGPDRFRGQPAELLLPFTHVEKSFVGERYADFHSAIPPNADYAVQVEPGMQIRAQRSLREALRRLLTREADTSLAPVRAPRIPDSDDVARMSDRDAREWAFKAGLHAYEQGYFAAAKSCLDRASALDPDNARARMLVAACCLKLEDPETALAEGLAALRIDPSAAEAQALVGDIHTSMGSFEAALEYYLKALEIKPTERAPLERIRELQIALSDGGAAIDQAHAAMRTRLMQRLEEGALDEQGYRTLLQVRERTRDGLQKLLPVACAAAKYRSLDTDELIALDEIFDAAGDSRRREELRSILAPETREALLRYAASRAPFTTSKKN